MRAAKRGGRRKTMYFRRLPAAPDERRALKAVCDWDQDGFPDAVLDDCGPGGCGATALLLKPKTGEVVTEVIVPPAERP
ncbi:MAG: hypothetical protein HY079_08550 [Elusimicrobia bacterium]|nr:hypothetical protein [Elusimicrobiota bacterium]